MKVKVTQDTTWNRALNAARRTAGKPMLDKEPTEGWRKMALMAEHSPIKLVEYTIMFEDLRQWVGVHLLRHEHTLPFIHTQRVDRRADIEALTDKVMAIVSEDIKNEPDFNRRDYLLQGQPLSIYPANVFVRVHQRKPAKRGTPSKRPLRKLTR